MVSSLHSHGFGDSFSEADDHGGWSGDWGRGYDLEDEFVDQLTRLPSSQEVGEVIRDLRVVVLRVLAADLLNEGIGYAKGDVESLEFVRNINSWFATAEEAVEAGPRARRIAARRKRTA